MAPKDHTIYSRIHDCFSREKLFTDMAVDRYREFTITWEQSRDKVMWETVLGTDRRCGSGPRGRIDPLPKLPSSCLRYLRIAAIPIPSVIPSSVDP